MQQAVLDKLEVLTGLRLFRRTRNVDLSKRQRPDVCRRGSGSHNIVRGENGTVTGGRQNRALLL